MADETTTQVEQGAQDPKGEHAQPDATGEKAERVYKQSEVEALIRDRLASMQRKSEEAAKKAAADAERKAAEDQGKWKELAEKYQAEAETERQRAQAASLAVLRRDVAARLNVPAVLADRIVGDTPEEMEADARQLLSGLPKAGTPTANAGNGARQQGAIDGKNMNSFIRAAAGRG